MLVKQLYTNCLAEAAYYIESNGEAAIIDPIRERNRIRIGKGAERQHQIHF